MSVRTLDLLASPTRIVLPIVLIVLLALITFATVFWLLVTPANPTNTVWEMLFVSKTFAWASITEMLALFL